MDDEYLYTLEEIKTALNMGMKSALIVLKESTDRTPAEIQDTADNLINMISHSMRNMRSFEHSETVNNTYSAYDLNNAFIIGLESAKYILEKSMGLSPEDQRLMLECLKKMIADNRVKVPFKTINFIR